MKKRPAAVGADKPCGHVSQDRAAAVSDIQVVAKRNPRIWFLGRRVALADGNADKAKVALQKQEKDNRDGVRSSGDRKWTGC